MTLFVVDGYYSKIIFNWTLLAFREELAIQQFNTHFNFQRNFVTQIITHDPYHTRHNLTHIHVPCSWYDFVSPTHSSFQWVSSQSLRSIHGRQDNHSISSRNVTLHLLTFIILWDSDSYCPNRRKVHASQSELESVVERRQSHTSTSLSSSSRGKGPPFSLPTQHFLSTTALPMYLCLVENCESP